ncbi:hypothetical protein SCANM63S_06250 [Streptomyces canarius]
MTPWAPIPFPFVSAFPCAGMLRGVGVGVVEAEAEAETEEKPMVVRLP